MVNLRVGWWMGREKGTTYVKAPDTDDEDALLVGVYDSENAHACLSVQA